MYSYPWYHWITFFYIYCFFGWIFESTYVTMKTGHFVNRGFLRLPLLPLYGSGAIMMLWFSLPFRNSIIMVFIAGAVAATILEYITGYAMERLFKMKYWDYSNQRFNLHGYICLSSSIAWGFLTIFLTEVVHQPVSSLVLDLSPTVEFSIIGIISVLFLSDVFQSTKEALNLGRALEALTKLKAELEEVQVQLSLLKSETGLRMAELKEETVQRIADVRLETAQRMADMKSGTAQRMADMKSGTAQRVADMKSGTAQRVADMKSGTAQRVADMKSGTAQRMAGAAQKFMDRTDLETALSEHLKALSERRLSLSRHMTFYRKSILRGNPTSSSRHFAEALKELKEAVDNRKKTGKKGK